MHVISSPARDHANHAADGASILSGHRTSEHPDFGDGFRREDTQAARAASLSIVDPVD